MTKVGPAGQYRNFQGYPLLSPVPAEFGPKRKPKRSSEESDPTDLPPGEFQEPIESPRDPPDREFEEPAIDDTEDGHIPELD